MLTVPWLPIIIRRMTDCLQMPADQLGQARVPQCHLAHLTRVKVLWTRAGLLASQMVTVLTLVSAALMAVLTHVHRVINIRIKYLHT